MSHPMKILDRLALSGMAIGIVSILQPWWTEGLRTGFFATLIFTALHIVTSHKTSSDKAAP
ncbi:MAG: hypothetical protein HOH43_10060 [Candidatus Latescibacteria bacterium]|nr:hypothetical protein [Candidatus Latescibacterota bacterium]